MKNQVILFLVLCASFSSFGQILTPVTWSTAVEKLDDSTYKLVSTASIDSGWHLYSQTVPKKGPVPTLFEYNGIGEGFELIEATNEEEGHTVNDPVFKMTITYFEASARFEQSVRVTDKNLKKIEGFVEFMACDNSRCLPPTEVDLAFEL